MRDARRAHAERIRGIAAFASLIATLRTDGLRQRASDTGWPPVAWPSKRPGAAMVSCPSGSLLWLRMTSAPPSNVHLRLVKKLPGQPPSGRMAPSLAPGAPVQVHAARAARRRR